jgi:hypothetical protein
MYWLRISVEKVADGLAASSGAAGAAGAAGSSAHAAMKGKEIVKSKTMHANAFFLIADEFISFAPFLMLRLELPFLSLQFSFESVRTKFIPVQHFLTGPQRF